MSQPARAERIGKPVRSKEARPDAGRSDRAPAFQNTLGLGDRPARNIRQRALEPGDRPAIEHLLKGLSAFTDAERAVALELVDARLAAPEVDDYRFVLSFAEPDPARKNRDPEVLAGYLCYGRTPMTQSTYDLYWIATSPEFARSGVARGLIAAMAAEIGRDGGGLVRVETGSREGHAAAVHFYDALGFERTAVIPDFYAIADDLVIFTKKIVPARGPEPRDDGGLEEAALIDAAFSYRDYALERDFLLTCAKRHGGRDVKRVLGWACGAGRHLCAFADVGIAAVGADASEETLAFARRVAGPSANGGAAVDLVHADLDEDPKVGQVDLSFVPLSTIHQLTSPEALERHLRLAASLLAPGGIHVIEATHPEDLLPNGVNHTEWTEVRNGEVVDARFRMHFDRARPTAGPEGWGGGKLVPVTLEAAATRKGAGGSSPARPIASLRQDSDWYVPDLEGWQTAIARVPELTLAATLGDFNADVRYDHEAAWRLILVLRRA